MLWFCCLSDDYVDLCASRCPYCRKRIIRLVRGFDVRVTDPWMDQAAAGARGGGGTIKKTLVRDKMSLASRFCDDVLQNSYLPFDRLIKSFVGKQ
jgi:hypothetical protein